MEPRARTYVLTCLYGLEEELLEETVDRLEAEGSHGWSEVVLSFDGPPERLRELRLARNVFLQMDSFLIGPTFPDLDRLEKALSELPLAEWESCWNALNGEPPGESAVSVSVDRSGDHNYTYKDVEELGYRAVAEATGRATTLEAAPLELRIDIRQERCRVTGRLTPRPLSERPYRVRHDRAETDATLAAAMLRMSEPTVGEAFLDPFCGVGTIAIERALLGPAEIVAAGDVNLRRLGWAAANVEAAGVDVHLAAWDAERTPLPERAFTRLVTTPPHSNPADGRPWGAEALAPLIAGPLRTLEYGGISVWLLRYPAVFRQAFELIGLNRVIETLECEWKGKPCHIYVLERVP